MLGTGFEVLANFPRIHSSCLLEVVGLRTRDWKRGCLPEREYTHNTQFFLPPSECHTRCSDTEVHSFGVSCWLTWASECKRPLGRPFVLFLQESTGNQWEGVPSWRLRSRTKTSQVNRTEQFPFKPHFSSSKPITNNLSPQSH